MFFSCTGIAQPGIVTETALTLLETALHYGLEHEQLIVCRIRRASARDDRSAERITEQFTRLIDGNGGVGGDAVRARRGKVDRRRKQGGGSRAEHTPEKSESSRTHSRSGEEALDSIVGRVPVSRSRRLPSPLCSPSSLSVLGREVCARAFKYSGSFLLSSSQLSFYRSRSTNMEDKVN